MYIWCKLINLFLRKKASILYEACYSKMCVITYFNTICVHPSKSAYSSFKMRTVEKEKQSPPLGFNWAQHDCITYFDRITHP